MNLPRVRRPDIALTLLTAALLVAPACDKITGGGEDKSEEKTEEATPAKTDDAEAKKGDDEKAEEDKKAEDGPSEDEAKRIAEIEATKAEEERRRAEEEEAKKKLPLVLSNLEVTGKGGMFGSGGTLELKGNAKINEKLESSMYVHVKSMCKRGDGIVSDVGYLNSHYSKPLDAHEPGEETEVTGTIFTQGLSSSPSPCQMEFRLGGWSGISVPLGHVCYDGASAKEGKCDPEIVAIAESGSSKPVEIAELNVTSGGGFSGTNGLEVQYLIKINKAQEDTARLTMKTSCTVDAKTFVDLSQPSLNAGPFSYEAGESLARSNSSFWNPSFEFTSSPTLCDVVYALWTNKPGTWGEYDVTEVSRSCFRDGKVSEGACDPARATTGTAAKITKDNVEISDVVMTLSEPWGAAGQSQLSVRADATVKEFIDQSEGISATLTCKTGKEKRIETAYLYSVDLYYLEPGETTRMSSTAFTSPPMDKPPTSCEVAFTGGARFSSSGGGVDLGKFCLKKEKIKPGKC